MGDVGLDRVQGASRTAIGIVNTDGSEQSVGSVTKHLQITGIRHVTVVVDPFRPHLGVHQAQRTPAMSRAIPRCRSILLVQALLDRSQRSAGANVVLPQNLLDRDEVVVPKSLELADGA